jgi:hypothetical protein
MSYAEYVLFLKYVNLQTKAFRVTLKLVSNQRSIYQIFVFFNIKVYNYAFPKTMQLDSLLLEKRILVQWQVNKIVLCLNEGVWLNTKILILDYSLIK